MLGLIILLATALLLVMLALTIMLVYEATHPPRRTAGYAVARNLPIDPSELDLSYEQWTLDLPDGAQLPVWEITGSAETQPHLTAVFVHGWGHSRIDWLLPIKPWLAWCHRVVLYDRRGHGESSHGTSPLGNSEDRDLLTLLEHLREHDAQRFILVGHSMGAVIALAAAAQQSNLKDAIAGVVAYGPYLCFYNALRARLRAMRYPARPMIDLMLTWLNLRRRSPLQIDKSLTNVHCPVLIIRGSEDALATAADAQYLAQLAPHARFHQVQGGGHWDPLLLSHPAHLEQLAAFAQQLTQQSAPASGNVQR